MWRISMYKSVATKNKVSAMNPVCLVHFTASDQSKKAKPLSKKNINIEKPPNM